MLSRQITAIRGIPIVVDVSVLFTLALVVYSYHLYLQTAEPNWGISQIWLTSLGMGFLLYGSVLAHELGHSFVALRQGIPVRSITLFLLGGLATIQRESRSIGGSIQLALAGPLVSLAIAASFWTLSQILPEWGAPCARIAQLNLILGAFNLIPILPLDGGHVLTALIWKLTGNRLTGVRSAAFMGQVVGGAAIGIGLALLFAIDEAAGLWSALVGGFIFRNSRRYQALARLQNILLTLNVGDLPFQPGHWVEEQTTVEAFVQIYLAAEQSPGYFITHQAGHKAWLDLEAAQTLERSQWATTPIANFAQPVLELAANLPLHQAILQLESHPTKKALVTSPSVALQNDAVLQWIDPSTILAAVGAALKLTLNPSDLEQAQLTGSYPTTLNLKEVSQALEWIESPLPS